MSGDTETRGHTGRPRAASMGQAGGGSTRGRWQDHSVRAQGRVQGPEEAQDREDPAPPQRHQGPRWWLPKCVRKPQASERAPQASLLPQPRPLPHSAHTSRACSCRIRPRTTLASSSEWPPSWAGTCTQEQGSPQSACSELRHCRSSSESRQPGRPSRLLPREESGQWAEWGTDRETDKDGELERKDERGQRQQETDGKGRWRRDRETEIGIHRKEEVLGSCLT